MHHQFRTWTHAVVAMTEPDTHVTTNTPSEHEHLVADYKRQGYTPRGDTNPSGVTRLKESGLGGWKWHALLLLTTGGLGWPILWIYARVTAETVGIETNQEAVEDYSEDAGPVSTHAGP